MDNKFLMAIVLSISTLFIFHYFNRTSEVTRQMASSVPTGIQPGQSYTVPSAQQLSKPINLETDFLDKKIKQKEEIKTIETDFYVISFSNYGGVVSGIKFKKHIGKNGTALKTIQHKGFYEREQASFLLALDEKTPYFYNLVDIKDLENQIEVIYQTKIDKWLIKKKYVVSKKTYQVDLFLDFEPKSKEAGSLHPRIFFKAPFVGEVEDDKATGIASGLDGRSISKISDSELDKAWVMPAVFGAEDKYFAHTLINDKQNFTQRAFFKKEGGNIFPILEGPEVKEKSSWQLSFYMGPKLLDDLVAVDERLEDILNFGWLSWFCKLILKLLTLLYSWLGNFGFAIIFLTILIKLPFIHMSIKGRKRMEEYQKYQPTLQKINLKYRHDAKRKQEEILRFHKEHNISPAAPIVGCLPQIIQLPILFALYRVLDGYLAIYQAPFFGWITDLSARDPYYIWPVFMGAAAIWQQALNPVKDPRQKVMFMFLPLIMVAVFARWPVGLVIYWCTNNLLMVGEDYLRRSFFK